MSPLFSPARTIVQFHQSYRPRVHLVHRDPLDAMAIVALLALPGARVDVALLLYKDPLDARAIVALLPLPGAKAIVALLALPDAMAIAVFLIHRDPLVLQDHQGPRSKPLRAQGAHTPGELVRRDGEHARRPVQMGTSPRAVYRAWTLSRRPR